MTKESPLSRRTRQRRAKTRRFKKAVAVMNGIAVQAMQDHMCEAISDITAAVAEAYTVACKVVAMGWINAMNKESPMAPCQEDS